MFAKIKQFLETHPTKITGALISIVGGLQAQSSTISQFMTAKHFALFTVCSGVVVSILGFVNSNRQ